MNCPRLLNFFEIFRRGLVDWSIWLDRFCESIMTIPDSGFMIDNDASCLPLPPEEEKRIVKELTDQSEANLKEGNLYYVVSNR